MIVLDEGQALGVDEAEEIEVEDAVAREAGELAGRFVGVDDPESGIDDEYGQAGVLGQGPEALLGIPRSRDRDGPLGRRAAPEREQSRRSLRIELPKEDMMERPAGGGYRLYGGIRGVRWGDRRDEALENQAALTALTMRRRVPAALRL